MDIRRGIDVSGIVQGVGFRPYIYRLTTSRGLKGTIRNTAAGVTIEIQGPSETVRDFTERLPAEAPLARITSFAVSEVPCNGDGNFSIIHGREG
jgi:hydrogenase maturation protein HypF